MNAQRPHPTAKRPTRPIRTLHTATLGITRATVGALVLTRAVDTLRITGVDRLTATRLAWVARLAGIRDLALGAGLLAAMTTGRDTTTWLWAGMIADAADVSVFATSTARGHLPPAIGTIMATAALGGVVAAAPLTRTGPGE
ncbi:MULTISPECIES: hypothetical protein [Frankia]|uniref:Integral membrane protein n=1 Tax=Frankia alni (strain DSM 45986 / CECT 9034 / ACN14a) TaxID=326424 RepID=Q0RJ97_FRAAA|nr:MULTISPECIES: hypothetical protein [Frankia]CAJ62415.1 hypothetical protein FRAAL3772 [Frankia alni ACN14a]